MSAVQPKTEEELLHIKGIGAQKERNTGMFFRRNPFIYRKEKNKKVEEEK